MDHAIALFYVIALSVGILVCVILAEPVSQTVTPMDQEESMAAGALAFLAVLVGSDVGRRARP